MVEENFKIGIDLELSQDSLDTITRKVKKQIADAIKQGSSGVTGSPIAGGVSTIRSAREASRVTAGEIAQAVTKALASETSSFARASQDVVRAINQLTEALRRGGGGGGGAGKSATASTEAKTEKVSQAEIKLIAQRINVLKKLEIAEGKSVILTNKIEKELQELSEAITRSQKARQLEMTAAIKVEQEEQRLAKATGDLAAAREDQARKTRQSTSAGGIAISVPKKAGPQHLVSDTQQGPTNIRIGANIDVSRAAGSQREAGSGGGGISKGALLGSAPRVDTGRQSYQTPSEIKATNQAATRPQVFEAGAKEIAKAVAASIADLKAALYKASGGRADEEFFRRVGLAGNVRVGPGASPIIERTGRETGEHVGKTIKIVGDKLESFSNVITDRIRQLTSPAGAEQMGALAKTAARSPGLFEAKTRAMVSEVFQGLVPVQKGQPLAGFQKGGEALLHIQPSGELKERLSALEDEASVISELNKELWKAAHGVGSLSGELAKLQKAGVQVMSTFGLAEGVAADVSVERGEYDREKKRRDVLSVTMPVQTRNLAELGLGGAGAMRAARTFQPHQMLQVMGGGMPSVMGKGERELYQSGMYQSGAYKEFKTALVDPGKIADLFEDQMLYDPKLVKMATKEVQSRLVHQVAQGLQVGAPVAHGQVLGTTMTGEEVKFDKRGVDSKVQAIEKVIIDGLDAYRVKVEEISQTTTGMKMTERSGIKGIYKAVPNLAERYGLPAGTAIAMSTSSVARRGSLRLPMEMMANTIAEKTGKSAQEIADKLVEAMKEGGKDFATAVTKVAESYGLKGFTGAEVMTHGPLAAASGGKASIMTGKVAFGRLPLPGGTGGPLGIDERFFGAADIQGLKLSGGTAKMAGAMQQNLSRATREFSELRLVLESLTGDANQASKAVEGLAEVLPEQFKRLPQGATSEADLRGTLLDPDLKQALSVRIPTMTGEKPMRIPEVGVRVGQRDRFTNELGAVAAGSITRQLDRVMEQATKVRALRGQVPVTQDSEAMQEAANQASKAIRDEVAAIMELGVESKAGASAAEAFLNKMMPLVKALGTGPAGISFFGRGGEKLNVHRSPEQYVKFIDEAMRRPRNTQGQMLAVQDIVAQRAGGQGKIPSLGAVFKDLDTLNKVMEIFNIKLDGTSEATTEAIKRLEQLQTALVDMFSSAALSRAKPEGEAAYRKRSLAQAREAGASLAPMGVAVEFPTDVSKELEAVGTRLKEMKEAGADVDEALSAFGRMQAMSKAQKGIPRDVVLINQDDWRNLVQAVSKKYKIPMEEAMQRVSRPGLMQRYPITGPRSFLPARLQQVGAETLPVGNFGVAGPAAISSPEDLSAMLKPLMDLKNAKLDKLAQLGGVGEESKQLADEIRDLTQMMSGMVPVFRAIGLNLDFDGDKIAFHADVADKASSNLETYSDKLKKTINLEDAWISIMGKSIGKSGMGGVAEYSKFFGQVAKGRPEGLRTAVLRPADPEMAAFESHAHVAGKLSVALMSDAFNRMLLAVTGGGQKVGHAFETWIGTIMLGINKALAQKHGAGGTAGPAQFLKMFEKGQLEQIKVGLESGKGFLGELGEVAKAIRQQMKEQLMVTGAGPGGLQKLKEFFSGEGIGDVMEKELHKGNLNEIVEKAVKELDLYNMLVRMFEMMKKNMISALTKGGMSLDQAVGEVQTLLTPQGKTGYIKGITGKEILSAQYPGYAATRRKSSEELKGLSPAEKAAEVMKLLPEKITEEVNLQEIEPDAKKPAQVISQALKNWIESIKNQVTFLSSEQMLKRAGFQAHGAFAVQKGGQGPGSVLMQQGILEKFQGSLETLSNIGSGLADPSKMGADELKALKENLLQFVEVFGHENVHKYAKDWEVAIANIVRSLKSAQGLLAFGGPHGEAVKRFIGSTPSLSQKIENVKLAQAALSRGERQVTIPSGTQGGTKTITNLTQQKIAQMLEEARKAVAEELLAYQFNKRDFIKRMGGEAGAAGVPKQVADFLQKQLGALIEAKPEVLRAAQGAAAAINNGYIDGLIEAAENVGPQAAKQAAQSRVTTLMDFPGRGKFIGSQEKLMAQEQAIMEARSTHKLGIAGRLPTGELGFGMPRQIAGAERPELQNVAKAVADIQKQIIEGVAPEELFSLNKQLRGLAGKTAAVLGRLQKSGVIGGASPVTEMANIMQDFFLTVGQKMTNEARDIQRQISQMEQEGKTSTPEFAALLEKFDKKVAEINSWLEKASTERMGKYQQLAVGGVTTMKGDLLPGFKGLGLDVANQKNFKAAITSMAGEGAEGTRFINTFEKSILDSVEAIRKGASATEVWAKIFSIMTQYPQEMKNDANKLAGIFSIISKIVGTQDQQYGESANNLNEAAKNARKLRDALEGVSPQDYQQLAAALAGGSKQQRRVFARGVGGADLQQSIREQQQAAMQAMEGRRQMLEKLVKSPEYAAMGAPRHFEPQQFEIVDPKTGQVVQKLSAEFKRFGSSVEASMSQAGVATSSFGNQMRNALRRVVQWGFASGIIYGTVRAFQNLVSVITDVQSKVVNLQKVMDTTVTDFQGIQDSAVSMAKTFGVSIDDVFDGMEAFAHQGLTTNEIMDRTRTTMLAVNVTTLSTAEATDALTSAMKIFGDEISSSESVIDKWGSVASRHAVTAKDLAQAMQKSGSAAKSAGVDFDQLIGITTAIGAVTRESGGALATGIKFMMRSIRQPKAQREIIGAGVSTETAAGVPRGAADVLGDLANRWDKLTRAQQLNIAQAVGGVRHYNQFIVLMKNWQEALDASTEAQNSQGFAVRKNAMVMASFAKQMQVLRETVKQLALNLGKVMLPAMTTLVKGMQGMLNIVAKLPDPLKELGVAGAAAMITIHKAAWILGDTLDAVFGQDFGDKLKKNLTKAGTIGSAMGAAKSAGGAFKGMGVASALAGMVDPKQVKTLKEAMDTMRLDKSAQDVGALAEGFFYLKKGTLAWAESLKTAKGLLITTGIGALAIALGYVAEQMLEATKTGKEMEDQLYDATGQAQDAANALAGQGSQIGKLTNMWDKYSSAVETAADPKKLQDALGEQAFKSPLKALKDYQDAVAATGLAFAKLDPSSIEGISKTGDYIIEASDGMKALSTAAADAQRATAAALQADVVEAYANEITKAKGAWSRLVEIMSFGTQKMDLLTQLDAARDKINELADEMKKMAGEGVAPLHIQGEMNKAIQHELEIRGEILASAGNLKRILESLPKFSNVELAKTMISSEKIAGGARALAASGAAGREATQGTVQMGLMARQVGLGGIVGYESTANSQRLMQEVLEKGMHFRQGPATGAGQLGFINPEAAKTLIQISDGADKLAKTKEPKKVIDQARTVITGIDDLTGEMIYFFQDGIRDGIQEIRESDMSDELKKAMKDMLVLDRNQIEEAADKGKRLLTLQATGALAGIRIPATGMPEIGPGSKKEITVEQRIMGALPDEMERLARVQSELSEITKRYNEDLEESGDETEAYADTLQKNTNIMDPLTKQLAAKLKMEQYELTVLAHTEGAFAKLQQTLEAAADASKNAAIEEETRAELLKHTSGALKGVAVAPQLDFGKSMRELTAGERLQLEMGPGYSKTLSKIAGVEKSYESGISLTTDIRKQISDFNDMIGDLDTAGGKLSKELELSTKAKISGTTKGDQVVADEISKQGSAQLAELQKQTPTLDRMLEVLKTLVEVESKGTTEEKKKAASEGLGKVQADQLMSVLGAAGSDTLEKFMSTKLGITTSTTKNFMGISQTSTAAGAPNINFRSDQSRQAFTELANRIAKDYNNMASPRAILQQAGPAGNPEAVREVDEATADIKDAQKQLMAIPEVADAAREFAKAQAGRAVSSQKEVELAKQDEKRQTLINQIKEQRARVMSQLMNAEKNSVAETQKAAEILGAKEGFRLAEAAQGFANAIESAIRDFKKSEMLFYQKQGSDIEGAFARVGQPGFMNQFEQRRAAIEGGAPGPSPGTFSPKSIEQMGSDMQELQKVDFDEEEAHIKEKQDLEVSALREQQQQAEKLRDIIADQLTNVDLTPDIQSAAKDYLDTLTDQLSTSEMVSETPDAGGDVSFQGVPALDDARQFLQQIQEYAKDQAKAAEKAFQQEINQPIVDEQKTTNQLLTGISDILKSGQESSKQGGIPGATSYADMAGLTGGGGPAFASSKDVSDWVSAATAAGGGMSYQPTGMFKGGTGTVAFSDTGTSDFGSLAQNQVGLTNYNQVLEASNALSLGNRDLTTGAVSSNARTGRAPGSETDRLAVGNTGDQTKAQTEAINALGEKLDAINENINKLTTNPTDNSSQIVTAITDSGQTLAQLLGGTLKVSVDNTPIAVSVDGLESAFTSALSSSNLGAVGAEVADARLRLKVLEGIIDPTGPSVEDRITAATDKLSTTLDATSQEVNVLETSVSDLSDQVATLTPLIGIDNTVNTLSQSLDSLSAKVDTNTTDIVTIQGQIQDNTNLVNSLQSSFSDLSTSVDDATAQVADAISQVKDLSTTVSDFDTRISTAEKTVQSAVDSISNISDSLDTLRNTVEINKQDIQASLRDTDAQVTLLETKIDKNTGDIQVVRSKTETALSQAQQALNLARQPKA